MLKPAFIALSEQVTNTPVVEDSYKPPVIAEGKLIPNTKTSSPEIIIENKRGDLTEPNHNTKSLRRHATEGFELCDHISTNSTSTEHSMAGELLPKAPSIHELLKEYEIYASDKNLDNLNEGQWKEFLEEAGIDNPMIVPSDPSRYDL